MLVTVDVLSLRSRQAVLSTWREPETCLAPGTSFSLPLLLGRGAEVHAPWRVDPAWDDGLRGGMRRQDGWGLPDLRRVALISAWPDHAAVGEPRFAAGTVREHWRGVFRAVKTHGSFAGTDPLRPDDAGACADQPAAALTCGVGGRHLAEFIRQNGRVVTELRRAPGLLTAFNVFGFNRRPLFCTFSCWSEMDQALAFAYRQAGEHREAIMRSKAGYYAPETYFARLALERSAGSIAGRDPFAGLVNARAA